MKGSARPRRKRVIRRILGLLVLLLILGGAGLYAYGALKAEYTVTYDTYTATTGSISNALSFSGNLGLVDSATYVASASGTVRKVYAGVGDEVAEGDKLLRLSSGETITADFSGRVNKLSVAEGDEVVRDQELVQLADFRHLTVSFRVDEYDISDVAVGQACTVTVTALETQLETTVSAIDYISASGGNVAYYTATARVEVEDARVLPGMQATVNITKEEAMDAVILKVDAVSFDETNQAFVWMKGESGGMEQVYVTTGVSNGNYIEITGGLSDGDEVYVEAKSDETSAATSFLSGLFGGQQVNPPQGGGNGPGGNGPGGDGNWRGGERTGERTGERAGNRGGN